MNAQLLKEITERAKKTQAYITSEDYNPLKLRGCIRKKPYNSENEAKEGMLKDMLTFRNPQMLNVYKCEFCDKWHVGHKRYYKG